MRLQYRDWAWNAFVAINATSRTDSGFAALSDVNAADGGSKYDNQESFLFAEVMKYSYLIHAEGVYNQSVFECQMNLRTRKLILDITDAEWQVKTGNENTFVFNTEAHPVRVKHT